MKDSCFLSLYVCIGYPKNCDDAQIYIKEHDDDLIEDIICYNNKPQKKIGIFPW